METFQKIELRKTRDFGEKFNATFEFIRQNYKGFMPAVLFISVPLILIGMVIISYYTYFVFINEATGMIGSTNPFAIWSMMGSFMGIALLAYLFIIVGYLINSSLVFNYLRIYSLRENPTNITVGELWNESKKDIGSIFVAGLLVVIVAGIGFMFLVIPGIYLMVTLSLILPILIFERKSIGDAFSRCFYLIKDKWWSTFGLIFIAAIIQWVMSLIFNIPNYVFSFLIGIYDVSTDFFTDFSTWKKVVLILLGCVSVIGSTLLYCIGYIAIAFQYFNLVERREATGLMNQIEGFGTSTASTHQDPKESY